MELDGEQSNWQPLQLVPDSPSTAAETTDLTQAVGMTRLIFSVEISEMESSVGMQDNKTFAPFLSGRNSHLGIFTELLESDE